MASSRLYLDHNAGAPLRPEAREAMFAALAAAGNASSVHAEGREARNIVEGARERLASLMRARPRDLVFTSGATEAANTVLTPDAPRYQNPAPFARLLAGATEHIAVLAGHRFRPEAVEAVPVDGEGRIAPEALGARVEELTAAHGIASLLVAVQAANNETGVLQPVAEIARRLRDSGAILVCDAAQSAGRLACDAVLLQADVTLLSSHKLGGPQGAGAIVYGGDHVTPAPLIRGGGQEGRRRAGTENVAAIAGFAAAAAAAWREIESFAEGTRALRDGFERWLSATFPGVVVFGREAERLPNTTLFALPGLAAETAVIALDLEGVAVSSGAACSSGKVAPSHVLAAMGVPGPLARGAVRVSFGWDSSEKDLDRLQQALARVAGRIRRGRDVVAA